MLLQRPITTGGEGGAGGMLGLLPVGVVIGAEGILGRIVEGRFNGAGAMLGLRPNAGGGRTGGA